MVLGVFKSRLIGAAHAIAVDCRMEFAMLRSNDGDSEEME